MMMEENVTQSEEALNDNGAVKEAQASTPSHNRWWFLLAGGLFLLIVLALALGLGLGLRHNNSGALAAATASPSTPAGFPTPTGTPAAPLQPWRLDTLEYNLDLSWNVSAPPTTRIFNLTISEIKAAPDGEFLQVTSVR
jgi:hypothetical protein